MTYASWDDYQADNVERRAYSPAADPWAAWIRGEIRAQAARDRRHVLEATAEVLVELEAKLEAKVERLERELGAARTRIEQLEAAKSVPARPSVPSLVA